FDVEDLALLRSFAAHAATAIENARLYADARQYAERLRALEEVNRLVSSSLEPDEVLVNLARAIAQFFDAPYVSLWSLDEATGRLRRALTHGDSGLASELHQELAPGEGAVGWVVAHREPIPWTDVVADSRIIDAPALLQAGVASFTAYPILIRCRIPHHHRRPRARRLRGASGGVVAGDARDDVADGLAGRAGRGCPRERAAVLRDDAAPHRDARAARGG